MIKDIKVEGFDYFRKGKNLRLYFVVEYKDGDKMREENISVVYNEEGTILETGSLYSSSNSHEYYIACGRAFEKIVELQNSDFIKDIIDKCSEIDVECEKNIENISNERKTLIEEREEINKVIKEKESLINNVLSEIKKLETDKKRCKKESSIAEKQSLIDSKLEELEKLKSESNIEELKNKLLEIRKRDYKFDKQIDKFYDDYRVAIKTMKVNL